MDIDLCLHDIEKGKHTIKRYTHVYTGLVLIFLSENDQVSSDDKCYFIIATHDLDLSDNDEKIACHNGISGTVDIDSGNSSTHSPSPMDPYQSMDTPSSQKQRASPTKCTSATHRKINEHCKMKSPSLSDGRIFIVCFYTSMAICRSYWSKIHYPGV